MVNRKTGRQYLHVGIFCPDLPWETMPLHVTDVYHDCNCAALFDPSIKEVFAFGCTESGYYAYPGEP
jgi:hypothetical protein